MDAPQPTAYDTRKAERIKRLEAKADRLATDADAKSTAAMQSLRQIPPGQPILVGHHSERRHRSHLNRVDSQMRSAIETGKAAERTAERAQAAASRSDIDSDDPNAPAKLAGKVAKLEAQRDRMKAANAAYRKAGKPDPSQTDAETEAAWATFAGLIGASEGYVRTLRASMANARTYGQGRKPHESYELSNLGARIRTAKQRAEALEAMTAAVDRIGDATEGEGLTFGAVSVEFDETAGRVFITTPGRNEDARKLLRGRGWVWSRRNECWSRKLTPNAVAVARDEVGPKLGTIYGK